MKNKIIEINGKKYKRITVNETPLWERELDEGWFSDLKAKAQQAYIKANPNSKYAKGEKSKKEKPKGEWVVDVSSVYGLTEQQAADINDEKINVQEWLIDHVKRGIIEVVNIEEL